MTQNKRHIIFCEPCGHKEIVSTEDLGDRIIKKTNIPGGSPVLDPVTKKTTIKKGIERSGMVKCCQCGRGVVLKNLPEVYSKALKLVEEKEAILEEEEKKAKRYEDGKPQVPRPMNNEDFLG